MYKIFNHNPKLKNLLYLWFFTAFSCLVFLFLIEQILKLSNEQEYIAIQATLPLHKFKNSNPTNQKPTDLLVYKNSDYFFTLNYPLIYKLTESNGNLTFPGISTGQALPNLLKTFSWNSSLNIYPCPTLEVLVYENPQKLKVAAWLKNFPAISNEFSHLESTNFNSQNFVKLSSPAGDLVPTNIFVTEKNNYIYQLNYNLGLSGKPLPKECGNILNGFKIN